MCQSDCKCYMYLWPDQNTQHIFYHCDVIFSFYKTFQWKHIPPTRSCLETWNLWKFSIWSKFELFHKNEINLDFWLCTPVACVRLVPLYDRTFSLSRHLTTTTRILLVFVFLWSYCSLLSTQGLQNLNLKRKMKWILVVVVKWCHHENGLLFRF